MNTYHVFASWAECKAAGHYGGTVIKAASAEAAGLRWATVMDYRNAFVVSHGPEDLGSTWTFKYKEVGHG
jgi:hypothetical protein